MPSPFESLDLNRPEPAMHARSRISAIAALIAIFAASACSEPTETPISNGDQPGAPSNQPPQPQPQGPNGGGDPSGGGAADQASLAQAEGAIKVTGTVDVPGWEKGQIQIDVHTPSANRTNGDAPVAVVRVPKPGPFEIYLPKGTEKISISAILDYEGNGPDAEDISIDYPSNPVDVSTGTATLTITINRDTTPANGEQGTGTPSAAAGPGDADGPPQPQPGEAGGAAVPPTEATTPGGAPAAGGAAPAAPDVPAVPTP